MGKVINVRGLAIGEGRPKICVPIVAADMEGALIQAEKIRDLPADLVEWRVDHMEEIWDKDVLLRTAAALREELGNLPLLATIRTTREGGEAELCEHGYEKQVQNLIASGSIDLIDIEISREPHRITRMIKAARDNQVAVIMSSHDFEKTPDVREMVTRLYAMKQMGADIAKLAVMPHSSREVLDLLDATVAAGQLIDLPLITMAMGSLGMITRLSGETFGSAVTFASAGEASAPGQIDVCEMDRILDVLHF